MKHKKHPRPLRRRAGLALAITMALGAKAAWSDEKLDMSFIQGGSSLNPEAWAALNGNYAPGRYLVELSLNGRSEGKQILDVTPQDTTSLCLTDAWLAKAGIFISRDYFRQSFDTTRECYVLSKAPAVTVDFDVATQSLALGIPQRGLVKTAENVEWDYGTDAFRMNYNLNGNTGRHNSAAFGSTDLKANIGRWVVSSLATATTGDTGGTDASIEMFTATRAIQALRADLAVGKTQTGSYMLGSTGTWGVSLSRNNSMRPGNLGYTPVFTGVANSPSRVTLLQSGRTIYSDMVPTGPFSITDVPLYTSGDVTMTITGEDGREQVQVIPLSVMAGQLSPGQHEFNIAGGMPDDDSNRHGGVFSASYGYGLPRLTLRAGGMLNNDWRGASAGAVTDLGWLGAFSADVAHAWSEYDTDTSRSGDKYQLGWSKQLELTNTGLRVSWSLQDRAFEEISAFDTRRWWDRNERGRRVKDEWTAGISQPVVGLFSLSVSGWQRNYYDDDELTRYAGSNGKDRGITGALSTYIKGISINLAVSATKNAWDENNRAVSASVSIPFTLFDRRFSSNTAITDNKDGGTGFSTGISSSLNDRFSYGVGGGRDSGGGTTGYANASWLGDKANLSGTVNHSSSAGTSGSASIGGSVLAVPEAGDVMLSRTTNDTVAVVRVKDIPGVRLTSGIGETDADGSQVVPLNSYDWNTVTIDAGSLPMNTELTTTSQRVVPTDKAVVFMPFDALKVRRYLLQVRQKNGEFVPGGSWARDSKNTPLGFVANNGLLMLNAVDIPGDITLGQCRIPAAKLQETEKLQEITCD